MGFLTNYVSSRTQLSFISFHHTMNICNVAAIPTITTDRWMIMHIKKIKSCIHQSETRSLNISYQIVWNSFLNKCISHPRIKTQKKEEEKLPFTCQRVPQSLEGIDAIWRALKESFIILKVCISYRGMVGEWSNCLCTQVEDVKTKDGKVPGPHPNQLVLILSSSLQSSQPFIAQFCSIDAKSLDLMRLNNDVFFNILVVGQTVALVVSRKKIAWQRMNRHSCQGEAALTLVAASSSSSKASQQHLQWCSVCGPAE